MEGTVTYGVGGMSCGGCVASVTKAVERLGVKAEVDLAAATVKVAGAVDEARLRKAIEDAGYDWLGRK